MQEQRINKYSKYVVAEDFLLVSNYNSVMQLPFFLRTVINTTSKEYLIEKKQSINALAASFLLSGQKTIPTRARKSIAGFKLREGALIGCRTTLRKKNMYTILDKLLIFVLPRLYSEERNNAVFEVASLLFLKKSSKASVPAQVRQNRLSATNKGISFLIKRNSVLNQGNIKRTELLSQQERYQLIMYLITKKKSNIDIIKKNKGVTYKSPIYHLTLGIKDLLLIPELQEFLPLFESVRGVNVSVSFANPRIKGTFLTTTLFSSKQEFALQKMMPQALKANNLKGSTYSHNSPKNINNVIDKKRGLFNYYKIEDFTFDYNPVERYERKDKITLSFRTNSLIKTCNLLFNSSFAQKQGTEKGHTFCIPLDASHSKGNQKIFFLSCFQYPRK